MSSAAAPFTVLSSGRSPQPAARTQAPANPAPCMTLPTVDGKTLPVGTVVSIADGTLHVAPARGSYDRRVVGIVTGTLEATDGTAAVHIATAGMIQIRVGLEAGQIAVGDLLIASNRPGVAVRARDPYRAIGAIVAKAMEPVCWKDVPHGAERLIHALVMR